MSAFELYPSQGFHQCLTTDISQKRLQNHNLGYSEDRLTLLSFVRLEKD